MDLEKIKQYLVDVKGMTPEEADAKLSGISEEDMKALENEILAWALGDDAGEGEGEKEVELSDKTEEKTKEKKEDTKEEETKLSDGDKKEEPKDDDKEKKLSAARTQLTKLAGEFKSSTKLMQLTAKRGRILTRLSKLQAEARITPAEVKKINLIELSAKSDEAVEAVLKSYADREPVLPIGQIGSRKADTISKFASEKKMSDLEARTRSNQTLLMAAERNRRLAAGLPEHATPYPTESVLDPAATTTETANLDAEYASICNLLDAGDLQGAKDALKALLARLATVPVAEFTDSQNVETERQLSTLAEGVAKMQTQFDEVMRLAGTLAGV